MSEQKENKLVSNIKRNKGRYLGIFLLLLGFTVLLITFYPLLSSYLNYYLVPPDMTIPVEIVSEDEDITTDIKKDTEIIYVDSTFGIYIPKIKANAPVIANVDPYNEETYTNALYKGVAHAKGSSFPDRSGNVFLFAHSAVNFYEQRKFNIYFYLLGELEKDDPIYLSYNGEIYEYEVLDNKRVNPDQIQYLDTYMDEDTLTIMTCWPAGSDFKRVIVTATRVIVQGML